MNTFIRVAEVWVPDRERTLLEFGGGWYGAARRFGTVSRSLCFGRGEGLPGQAWEEGRPIVLKQFEGSYFRRADAAREAGYTCAIAVPVFMGELLTGVVMFFCGGTSTQESAHDGAVELWRNNARVTSDMTLVDGYFGGTAAETFEPLTRDTFLPRGSGLPGMAWQRGAAVLIDDLGQTGKFIRADGATEVGINRGLAFPCSTPGTDAYVLALLSTTQTPIAKRIECWAPDESRNGLTRVFGFCETAGPLRSSEGGTVLAGAIGKAFASGVPVINDDAATEPGGVGAAAVAAGLQSLVALPVVSDGAVSEVVTLYF